MLSSGSSAPFTLRTLHDSSLLSLTTPAAAPAVFQPMNHHAVSLQMPMIIGGVIRKIPRPCRSAEAIEARRRRYAASDAHHRREGGAPRRRHHQSRDAQSRYRRGAGEGGERFRLGSRPRGGSRRSSARCARPIPTIRYSRRKAAPPANRSTGGSSIRSTARPTSCTAFRSTRFRSRSCTGASSPRRSSTIPGATIFSPPRAGAARS